MTTNAAPASGGATSTSTATPAGLTGLAAKLWTLLNDGAALPFELATGFGSVGGLGAKLPVPTMPAARSQWSSLAWAILLLSELPGVPITVNNTLNIMRWMTGEEPASSWLTWNNPLNARLPGSPGYLPNDAQSGGTIPGYATVQDGIGATASMIQQSNMSAILAALQQNAPTSTFMSAVTSSPWGTKSMGSNPAVYWASGTGGNPTGTAGQVASVLPTIWDYLGLGGMPTNFWSRLGLAALGVGMFGVGLWIFLRTEDTGEKTSTSDPVESVAKTAAKVAA